MLLFVFIRGGLKKLMEFSIQGGVGVKCHSIMENSIHFFSEWFIK